MSKRKFKVKVHVHCRGTLSYMYWTMRGSTVNFDEATVFTEATIPPLARQSLNHSSIERIYISE